MNRTDWLEQIAPVWMSVPNRTVAGDLERLVLFEGGLQVDLVFVPYDLLRQAADNGIIPDSYRRGARAIVDKEGLAAKLIPPVFTKPAAMPLPGQAEYTSLVEVFWFSIYYVTRQLRRGEVLSVLLRYHQLAEFTVRMAEWHAKATRGADLDTWHIGRFVEDWADPRAVDGLKMIFPHNDVADCWRALWDVIDLFTWLAQETAERLGITYPGLIGSRVRPLITGLAVGLASVPSTANSGAL